MSKKVPVKNSPWGRPWERPSDCARWIEQKFALMIDGVLTFHADFVVAVQRTNLEADPVRFDDGVSRRWVTKRSGGMGVQQLRPISEVGTDAHVTKHPDKLTETRQYRQSAEGRARARGYSILPSED